MASATMFVHLLCGLLRYLIDIRFVLALDYASTITLSVLAVVYYIQCKPRILTEMGRKTQYTLLLLFFGWFIVAQTTNVVFHGLKSAAFAPNALHDTLLLFFVFFPYGSYVAKNGVPNLGKHLIRALLILWSTFILFVLINVFMNKVVELPGDIKLGFYDYQAFNLNNNSNHTSCFEFVFFFLCIFMVSVSKSNAEKIMYSCFGLIHYTGMILSNSRTFLLAALVFCAALCFFCVYKESLSKVFYKRILLAVLSAICAVGLLYLLRLLLFEAYNYCKSLAGTNSTVAPKKLSYEGLTTLTSRTTIWKHCVKELFTNPFTFFFGEGIANSKQLVAQINGKELYTHNQFIEIAICAGFPALIAFMIFVFFALKNALSVINEESISIADIFISLCIPILLIANCAEALLMFYRRPGSYVFFICCGWLCEYVRQKNETLQNK